MRQLDRKTRSLILRLLVEGNSIRATARIADVSKNTVSKLLVDAGEACVKYHDENVRDVTSSKIQCDEIWTFTYAKKKNVEKAKAAPEFAGDTWTWTALDADTKLIVSYMVGGRDADTAYYFLKDLSDRLDNRVQLTTDGHHAYLVAARDVFGGDVDYAQLVKLYGEPEGRMFQERRYSPGVCTGTKKRVVSGAPDMKEVSTSYVERQNLTMRMNMRRFTRLTNAFSKKVENHMYAVALHFMFYNYCRIHQTLKITPAMAAGLTDRLWDIDDLVGLVEANVPAPKKRGPYKKKQTVDISK